jgi:hypothetical protein
VVFYTDDKATEISASSVKIEITDAKTGVTYTRELPIDYYETAYCLRLTGEGLDGKPASLVFYTDAGLGRLRDLTGGGADHDRCGGH